MLATEAKKRNSRNSLRRETSSESVIRKSSGKNIRSSLRSAESNTKQMALEENGELSESIANNAIESEENLTERSACHTPTTGIVGEAATKANSTPRRKNMLENLQSNLSPKYIGFNHSPSLLANENSEGTRSLRSRSTQNSPLLSNYSANKLMESPVARLNRSFESSPIDKLLLKNGASATSSCFEYLNKNLKSESKTKSHSPKRKKKAIEAKDEINKQNNDAEETNDCNINNAENAIAPLDNSLEQTPFENAADDNDETKSLNNNEPKEVLMELNENVNCKIIVDLNDSMETKSNNVTLSDEETLNKSEITIEESDNDVPQKNDNSIESNTQIENEAEHDKNEIMTDEADSTDILPKTDKMLETNTAHIVEAMQTEETIPSTTETSDEIEDTNPNTTEISAEMHTENTHSSSQHKLNEIEISHDNTQNITEENFVITPEYSMQFTENAENSSFINEKPSNDAEADLYQTITTPASVPEVTVSTINEDDTQHTEDIQAKSPSAISMDSAKGSSVNDASWMSYCTGDLFWGQIYKFCYWPCMVCPDPEGKKINTTENSDGLVDASAISVHVRFFADNARRNWVKNENLLPYKGLENFREKAEEILNTYGKNSTKYKYYVPKKSQLNVWQQAIREANIVAECPYTERLEKFYEIYEKTSNINKLERKRRQSMILTSRDNNSDMGSLYGSSDYLVAHENNNSTFKRERSVSPFSPAFSPVKSVQPKKRKLSSNRDEDEIPSTSQQIALSQSSSSECSIPALYENFKNAEFKEFLNIMREYIIDNDADAELEKSLVKATKNLWALKQLHRSMISHNGLKPSNGRDKFKRMSMRIKNILQQPLTTNTSESSNHLNSSKHRNSLTLEKPSTPRRPLNRPINEVIEDIFNLDSKYLFKGLARDPVCKYCFKPGGGLLRCAKECHNWLHKECKGKKESTVGKKGKRKYKSLGASQQDLSISSIMVNNELNSTLEQNTNTTAHITAETDEPPIVCEECERGEPICDICRINKPDEQLVACNMSQCGKYYHVLCCKYWPQTKITYSQNTIVSFRCASHVCHTCVSDDPKGKYQQLSNSKIVKCVKCPATYHADSTCIPAGTEIINASHIICPRHFLGKSDAHVNVNWCFICVNGGNVLCCETCPIAVHAACLNIPMDPDEGYICEECESGRLPLYGEMVWAKFNNFRWWPAIILPPTEVPQNIKKKPHNPLEFVVRFFGTHDHGWISRRRVYLYLEGDSSEPPKSKTTQLDQNYIRGVEEAKAIYQIVKNKKEAHMRSKENKDKLHPQPYIRIKTNKAVPPVKLHSDIEKVNKCECNPADEHPCGPESNCLNRVLYHECHPKVCPAGERCENQMFETRKSPRLDVVYMKEKGFGLVTREVIEAGAFVIEYVGEIIDDTEFQQRMAQKSKDRDQNFYFLSVERDYIIDAGPKGNLARFMNHSCEPNCETQKWVVNGLMRVGLFAITDIPENTEVTFNYHWDELLGSEKKTCYCGASKCAGQIGGKYKSIEIPSTSSAATGKQKGQNKKLNKALKRLNSKKSLKQSSNKLKVHVSIGKSNKNNKTIEKAFANIRQNIMIADDSPKSSSDASPIVET